MQIGKLTYQWIQCGEVKNRRIHARECIMDNFGKMERNSKVCVEVRSKQPLGFHGIRTRNLWNTDAIIKTTELKKM